MELTLKAKRPLEIQVKFRQTRRLKTHFHESISLTAGTVSFSIFHSTMSVPIGTSTMDEKQTLIQPTQPTQEYISSKVAGLQRLTRGYLWLVVACCVLLIAAGVLMFPQKTWNRMMLKMFGCVRFKINGHEFKMCQEQPQPQENPIF